MIKREVGGVIQCLRELRTLNSNNLRPNFKNLRCVTNFRRGSDMVGSTRNCIQCFEIWAGAQLEPVFGGLVSRFKFFKFGLSIIYLIKILNRVYHNIKPHSFNLLSVPPSSLLPRSWSIDVCSGDRRNIRQCSWQPSNRGDEQGAELQGQVQDTTVRQQYCAHGEKTVQRSRGLLFLFFIQNKFYIFS